MSQEIRTLDPKRWILRMLDLPPSTPRETVLQRLQQYASTQNEVMDALMAFLSGVHFFIEDGILKGVDPDPETELYPDGMCQEKFLAAFDRVWPPEG